MQEVLSKLQGRGAMSLNKIVAAYAQNGDLDRAIHWLKKMQKQGMTPDRNTFLSLLGLCVRQCALEEGRYIHACTEQSEYKTDELVQNALINMFGKCRSTEEALSVFESMHSPTVVSWNSLISAYAAFGHRISLFNRMLLDGTAPDRITFTTVLGACEDVYHGKMLHGYVSQAGLDSNPVVGTSLLNMYGRCGSVEEAREVFNTLSVCDVVSWSSMIVTYVQNEYYHEGIEVFHKMNQYGEEANEITYAAVFTACAITGSLRHGKLVHELVVERGFDSDVVVSCSLVNMYGKCGMTQEAWMAFSKIPHPNTACWNAVIAAHGTPDEVLGALQEMLQDGCQPDRITFVTVISCCCSGYIVMSSRRHLHRLVVEAGLEHDQAVSCALLNLYRRHSLEEFYNVFSRLVVNDLESCTKMVSMYVENGYPEEAFHLFRQMQLDGLVADKVTLITVLGACSELGTGEMLHRCVVEHGYESDVVVGNCLMTMYIGCRRIDKSREIFESMTEWDSISWNTVISGHASMGRTQKAMFYFRRMQQDGVTPDKFTHIAALDGVGSSRDAEFVIRILDESGIEIDAYLASALVSVHCRCYRVEDAKLVFHTVEDRDVVVWTSLINGYVQQGYSDEALRCSREMRQEGMFPNELTIVGVLNACSFGEDLAEGRLVHGHAAEAGLVTRSAVGNALVDMYAKCGCLREADRIFRCLWNRNTVSWNTIIAAHVQSDRCVESLELFFEMQLEGVKPDKITFVSALNGCPRLAHVKSIEGMVIESGLDSDNVVKTALLTAFTGSIDEVTRVFSSMYYKDIVSWNTVIAGNVEQGRYSEALNLFRSMRHEGVSADAISLVTVLNACLGLKEVKHIEEEVVQRGFLNYDVTVGNALVHMYGRSGRLVDASRVFECMDRRDLATWNAIVTSHAQHGRGRDALKYFWRMQQDSFKPDSITVVSVLSACSHIGLVEEGKNCFTCMERDYRVARSPEHYACAVDMLGRSGKLSHAEELIKNMPENIRESSVLWMSLLGACKLQGDEIRAKRAAEKVMELEPGKPAPYILLSSL